jgi:hypothetical protein
VFGIDRLRVGIAALKTLFECSWATAHCASKSVFARAVLALHCSSSLDLELCEATRSNALDPAFDLAFDLDLLAP